MLITNNSVVGQEYKNCILVQSMEHMLNNCKATANLKFKAGQIDLKNVMKLQTMLAKNLKNFKNLINLANMITNEMKW
jgi:hypothetical protein